MLRGESITDGWKSKETLEALDLCLSCKACATECPVNVDMATYKAEFLHHHYRHGLLSFIGKNRRPMAHFTMGWMPYLMRITERIPFAFRLINRIESFRPIEELTKRLGGIETKRRMITFAPQPLTAWFRRRHSSSAEAEDTRESVVIWPDTFTNFSADAPGKAAVDVLEAMGYRVLMPMGNVCCGLTWHSTGQLDMTKKILRDTLDVMEPLLRAGYPVIGLEPSCTVMLQDEITQLLPDDDRAALVSKLTQTLGAFATKHLKDGKPWPFGELSGGGGQPVEALCQVHCHQKSALGYDPELGIMEKLGVNTTVIGGGCCGLAGNWGFEPGHYDISQTLGERELFPAIRNASEGTLVLADGFSCRTQIAQGTSADGVHLAQIMRKALNLSDK
jgi:Fe-S oxidoreductase